MMAITLLSHAKIVQTMGASMQAASPSLLNLAVGSVLRAIIEAFSGVALWLQWLVLQVMQMARATTSVGTDLDSWMADYSFTRQAAVAAAGTVTFARFTNTASAFVAAGTIVKTADGLQSFTVIADTTNGAWNAGLNSYALAIGITSINAPVVAVTAGSAGNAQAATITLISAAIPGVDTVTNASAFTSGIDAETDTAFRARFLNYIGSLSRATKTAVGYAISTVQQGLTYTILENSTAALVYQPGNFVVTVDNGTGAPGSTILTNVTTAVDAYRPIGSTFIVQGPSVVTAAVAFTVAVATGYIKANMTAGIGAAVTAYINSLPMGSALAYSRIAQVVYDSMAGITNVTGVLVNSATADLGGGSSQVVRAGTISVS